MICFDHLLPSSTLYLSRFSSWTEDTNCSVWGNDKRTMLLGKSTYWGLVCMWGRYAKRRGVVVQVATNSGSSCFYLSSAEVMCLCYHIHLRTCVSCSLWFVLNHFFEYNQDIVWQYLLSSINLQEVWSDSQHLLSPLHPTDIIRMMLG